MTTQQRVALVTGAARGQGWAIVQRLRADGLFVAACDISANELRAAVDGLGDDGVIAIPLDVTSESGWQEAVATTADRFGSLTTLVNNAGVLHRASIDDESAEGFEKAWRVNCLGAFLGIRTALDQLRSADGAAIVEHLQHRGDPAVPEEHRLRVVEVGAARPDPGRRGRTRAGGHPRQRRIPRTDRDPDA